MSPALGAADASARPASNLPNVTPQASKETYLLLRYRRLVDEMLSNFRLQRYQSRRGVEYTA